jgi:D-glycero-alpha-D-manno-heptose-7-phosphate kinase
VIEVSVPVRICDNGGWTDTWFGAPGQVLNVAVSPGVEVSIRATGGPEPVVLDVATFGDRYSIVPGTSRVPRHPLLEAAIDTSPPPPGLTVEILVRSAVPAASGVGTSAAVAVSLLGGLAAVRAEQPSRRDLAYAAHRLEVGVLGQESGIQDQMSAAFGGINYLHIEPYPEARMVRLPHWEDLSSLMTLVFLGRGHRSSGLHDRVIAEVQQRGSVAFSQLRNAAAAAHDAVLTRDLGAFGRAMIANTNAQASLHPALVGLDATRVIDCARACGAIGWKVNGAGGDGGSLTLLSASDAAKEMLEHRLAAVDPAYRVIPIQINKAGLQVRGAL